MYHINTKKQGITATLYHKIWLIMRLTAVILLACLMQVSAATFGQLITIKKRNAPLDQILKEIRQQSGYDILSKGNAIANQMTSVDIESSTIEEAMDKALAGLKLSYKIEGKIISIQKQEGKSLLENILALFQSIDVYGTVLDESGRPLPGVTVKLKDNSKATITSASGAFTLKGVDEGARVVISYIGYKTTELPVKAEMGNISLELTDSKLDEVQVVAYGQSSQRLSTGNVTTVMARDIEKSPVNNPLLALQGRVTGLTIISSGGNANSNIKVSIQGDNSLIKGSDPFYVIDGVPYASEYVTGLITLPGANQGGSPLSFINPDDIESISVLKDADATAIYGSRAANGAILITTKKGRPGNMKVNLKVSQGYSEQSRWLKLMNTAQFLEMRKEAIKNDGGTVTDDDYDVNGYWENNANDHDWQKELSGGKGVFGNYNLSIMGGTNQIAYAIGGTFRQNGSIYVGDFSDKTGALHFNIDGKSKDQRFEVQLTGNYSNNVNSLPLFDIPTYALILAPNSPSPYSADGSLNWAPDINGSTTFRNPFALLMQTYRGRTTNAVGSMLLRYEIAKGLQFKTSLGYNEMNVDATIKLPKASNLPEMQAFSPSSTGFTTGAQKTWIVEPQLSYQRTGKLGTWNALVGATIQQSQNSSFQVFGSGFLSDANMDDILSATSVVAQNSSKVDYQYAGIFAQLNYNYEDKYLFQASARRDGSSRFGANNKFHNFGAVGLGYTFTEENFFKQRLKWLSFGKLRASYGIAGNDQIGDYVYLSLYRATGVAVAYGGLPGLSIRASSNPDIQWEETTKMNVGLDLGVWNDRFLLSANYFHNRSGNQFMSTRLPSFAGPNTVVNIPAIIRNTGFEFSLNSRNVSGSKFKWSSNLNFYAPRNKLLRFDDLKNTSFSGGFIVGEQLNFRRVYKYAGVNPENGVYQFLGSDGRITEQPTAVTDQYVVKMGQQFNAGFENTLSYKDWQLSFLFRYVQQKGEGLGVNPFGFVPGVRGFNALTMVLDRWQSSGQQAKYARFNSNGELAGNLLDFYRNSDATITNASFLSLQNVSLSWNLPEAIRKSLHLGSARLFFEGQNLLKFTPYEGLDPETLSSMTTPTLRTLTFGIQAGF